MPNEFALKTKFFVPDTYGASFKNTGRIFTLPCAHVWKFAVGKAISFQQYIITTAHNSAIG